MISLSEYKTIIGGHKTNGRARKAISDMVILNTWSQDIQSQTAYLFDYYRDLQSEEAFFLNDLHPDQDPYKIPIEIKFIRHGSQTYQKDPITFWLQMKPGQDCNVPYYDEVLGSRYDATFPIGLYVAIQDESGKYNRWLVVAKANYEQSQFPTFEVLRCDHLFQWIFDHKKYQCAGVLRSQNSQIVRFTQETMYRKFSNCWKHLLGYQYQNGNNLINRVDQQRSQHKLKRSTSKVGQVSENGNHLSLYDMVLICSGLMGDHKKTVLLQINC